MAKVKYIKLSDALELLRKEQAECSAAFEELGGEAGIYAEAYEDAADMLKELPTVEMEETEREKS